MWLRGLKTQQSLGEDVGLTPGLTLWDKNPEMPLWLWHRYAPLAQEFQYATGAVLKKKKTKLYFFNTSLGWYLKFNCLCSSSFFHS